MDLEEAIQHPNINVFDIVKFGSTKFDVVTYHKPNESRSEFIARHTKNVNKAKQLINKKPE